MSNAQPVADRPEFPATYGIDRAAVSGILPWDGVREQLTAARNYWLATTRPDGRPHVAPVWGLWLDEVFVFSTDPASVKGKNMAAQAAVAVHLESGDNVVILEGAAETLTDHSVLERFVAAYKVKYDIEMDITNADYGVYSVRPVTAQAWLESDFPATATRWKFAR